MCMRRRIQSGVILAFFVVYAFLAVLLLGSLFPQWTHYQIRIVESGSMEPAVPLGAAIVVAPAQTYTAGDIVTYQRREDVRATTHRLVGTAVVAGETEWRTRGDANDVADVTTVAPSEIVGKVHLSIPYLGFMLAWLQQPVGFLVVILVPALLIVREELLKIRTALQQEKASNVTPD